MTGSKESRSISDASILKEAWSIVNTPERHEAAIDVIAGWYTDGINNNKACKSILRNYADMLGSQNDRN